MKKYDQKTQLQLAQNVQQEVTTVNTRRAANTAQVNVPVHSQRTGQQ